MNHLKFQKTLKTLFCVLLPCVLYSQKPLDATTVKQYYQRVYAAERAIMRDDPQKALSRYEAAFALNMGKGLQMDVWNAWICAYDLRDKEFFARYLKKLRETGLYKDVLLKYPSLEKIRQDAEFWPLVEEELPLFSKDRYPLIPLSLKDSLKVLIHDDQAPRDSQSTSAELQVIDSLNFLRLVKLTNQFNYPNQGIYGQEAPYKDFWGSLIALHYIRWHNQSCADVRGYMQRLIKSFMVDARTDALSQGNCNLEDDEYKIQFVLFGEGKGDVFLELPTRKKLAEINRQRKENLLYDFNGLKKRMAYNLKNKAYCLVSNTFVGIFPAEHKDAFFKTGNKKVKIGVR
jgi:hypothetical protein